MVDFRRSRFRRHPAAGDAAPTQDPSATDPSSTAPDAAGSDSHKGLGWAVLGVAVLLGLFLLVPFGLERSSAVMPATSTGPAPQTSGPQTWVLSSTVAAPGPVAGDAERMPGHHRSGTPANGSDLIVRTPVSSATTEPTRTASATPQQSPAPASTSQLPTTTPTSPSPCPQPSATGITPLLDETVDGDLGSSAGTGDDDDAGDTAENASGGAAATGSGAPCPG